ncbi:sporulation protein YunB [Evansella caseinilytica]|uniref:Sporulation protein YunB n=1 Tax=Evansella caseinilytica TaxID=1503961 RepID=A0A1H3UCJ9_9BACI|nr:sporulation protein YunB [Evansella caseinilytica]SDZ60182.1 sporulation protein YunB [Evansella caseinilytica]
MRKIRTIRPRKKRRGPLPFRHVFLISLLIFCFLTVQGLIIIEKGIRPTLVNIAKTETQRIGTLAINDAISKKILEELGLEDLIVYERDAAGKVTYVDLNAVIYNRVLRETVKRVQDYLNAIERGEIRDYSLPTDVDVERDGATFSEDGIIHMIPLGQATKNSLLAHLGPRVPVRLSAIGDVKADFDYELETTGINNTWISVSIHIEVDVKIVIPFATDTEVVKTSIPVAMAWVPGDVPNFYSTGSSVAPGVVLPEGGGEEDIEIFTGNEGENDR